MTQQDRDLETVKRTADKLAGQKASVAMPVPSTYDEAHSNAAVPQDRPVSGSNATPIQLLRGNHETTAKELAEYHYWQPNMQGHSEADKLLCAVCQCLPSHGKHIDYRVTVEDRMDQSIPMGYNEPHAYKGTEGLIGGSCHKCGQVAGHPVHNVPASYDAVEPPHYQRGPKVTVSHQCSGAMVGEQVYSVQCIDVMRVIQDPRLATAFKYIWRVAFGGKAEPWDSRTPAQVDARDINSAVWYLRDYLANPPEVAAEPSRMAYDRAEVRDGTGAVVTVQETPVEN